MHSLGRDPGVCLRPKRDSALQVGGMSVEQFRSEARSASAIFGIPLPRTVASYESELSALRSTQLQLRETLGREDALLREKEKLLHQHDELREECNHRLLNGLQMVVSLLSLQSRTTANEEAALQLTLAANRVAAIERVHRRLNFFDGEQSVAFGRYLEDLCGDFSAMLPSGERPAEAIMVETIDVKLPTPKAISLGFIVNELITNAAKYGKGAIKLRFEAERSGGYALSVCNDGPALPEGFDPHAAKGLGMKIMRSFVERLGGQLQFGRGDNGVGARFTVLFD